MRRTATVIEESKGQCLLVALLGFVLSCSIVNRAEAQTSQAEQTQLRRVKRHSLNDLSIGGRLAALEEALKYPPESRPIDITYWDLLHPWNVDAQMRPMISEQTKSRIISQMVPEQKADLLQESVMDQILMPSSSLSYQFELNKVILAGTHDELQARLTVTPSQSSDAALRIHVSKAEMIGSFEFGSPNLGEVPFSCEHTSPVCTFTWHAPSEDKEYWGILSLKVALAVEGTPDDFIVQESFYSSPMVAGEFTGQFQERLENGSLLIDAGVNVQKRMACFVTANLYSAGNDVPLQHAYRRMLVDPSMKTVSFTFFGKIFHDYGDESAFRLQDLQAQCKNLAYPPEWFIEEGAHQAELKKFWATMPTVREPTNIYFGYNTHSYTTHKYPNSAFSEAEWQSPEKTRRLEIYKQRAAMQAAAVADSTLEVRRQQVLQQLIQQREAARTAPE